MLICFLYEELAMSSIGGFQHLLDSQGVVSPDEFNNLIASQVIRSCERDNSLEAVTEPRRTDGAVYSTKAKDHRLTVFNEDISTLRLPQAVIDKLGYNDVTTVRDWIKQLPIAKRINWNVSKKCRVSEQVYAAAVPLLKACTSSLYFAHCGNIDETWIHLCYSPNGQNIGEAVVTYNYSAHLPVVTGRMEQQNTYCMYPEEGREEHAAVIEPLDECMNDEAIAKATLITLAIKLNKFPYKENSDSPQILKIREETAKRKGTPPAWYTGNYTELHGFHSGQFSIAEDTSYISVVTATRIDCSEKTDKEAYIKSLPKKIERVVDAVSALYYGPTAEQIHLAAKQKFPWTLSKAKPIIMRLQQANSFRLDYTLHTSNLLESNGEVSIGIPSRKPLPTAMKIQSGIWWENFPQVVTFFTEEDKQLSPHLRMLAIYNYNPDTKQYERYVMNYYPQQLATPQ